MIWRGSPDPSIVASMDGLVVDCNDAMADLLGLEPRAVQGAHLAEMLGDSNRKQVALAWLFENLQLNDRVTGFEIDLTDSAGHSRILEGTARVVDLLEGSGIILSWRDVTQRAAEEKVLRERLSALEEGYRQKTEELAVKVDALGRANEELQRLDEARAELISLVSHQIRGPLTNMLGAVERMQASCSVPVSVCSRMFRVLRDQTLRLNRLVRDVLSLSRLEAGDFPILLEPVSIMPILEQTVEEFSARGGRAFELPYAPILPLVTADRDSLLEVLSNLLDNADKYSPNGGPVQIEVRPTETEVIISVADSGPGVPERDLDRVFDKFYRAEHGDAQVSYGYGLGLYVCQKLIELQRGRIWASNRRQGGARFSVALKVDRTG